MKPCQAKLTQTTQKFYVLKNFGQKHFFSKFGKKPILVKKNLWKKFCQKKLFVQKICGPKEFLVQKHFGPKRYLIQKN